MFRLVAALVLGFVLALSLFAQQPQPSRPDPMPVANRYLDAYSKLDIERLSAFWDDRSVFEDPTSAEIGAVLPPTRGAQAIGEIMRSSVQELKDVSLRFDERYCSAGYVIAIGKLFYTLPARMLGRESGDVSFELRVVSVLRIEGEIVVAHTDYTDFSGWRAKIAASGR